MAAPHLRNQTPAMAASHDFGRDCEEIAARYLASNGWVILARNFRDRRAEIDIIARLDTTIAFVEVKGRTALRFGYPLDAITAAKRRDIARAARTWLVRHGLPKWQYRFDAIAVRTEGGRVVVEHVEDAWRL